LRAGFRHNAIMRLSTPWWALLSSAAAPAVLIGGWTLAARRQPEGYDSTLETISSLAALDATDRWVMTVALLGLGVCHAVTALGLTRAAPAGRAVLGLGGAATVLVALFPLPAEGAAPAHGVAAGVAFVALAAWPALAWRRGGRGPVALRPVVSVAAAVALLALVAWFGALLGTDGRVGLAERLAAGAEACWPLVAVLSSRLHSRRGPAGPDRPAPTAPGSGAVIR
jgi:hypothetical membrane protein